MVPRNHNSKSAKALAIKGGPNEAQGALGYLCCGYTKC